MAYPPFLFSPHGAGQATGHRSGSDFSMNSILSGGGAVGVGGTPSHVHPAQNPFFPHMSPFHPAMHGFPNPFFPKFPHHFPGGGPNPNNPLSGGGPLDHQFGGSHTRPVRTIEPGQDDVEDDPKVELDQTDLWGEFHNIGTEMGKKKAELDFHFPSMRHQLILIMYLPLNRQQ